MWILLQVEWVLFLISFTLTVPLFSQVHRSPFLCKRKWGVSRAVPLPPGSSFSFFLSFSLLNPPFPLQAHWEPFVHRWGVSPFVESARAVPFRSRMRGMTPLSGSSFFSFFRSLTDPPLSHTSPTLRPCHVAFANLASSLPHIIFFMHRVAFLRYASPLCQASPCRVVSPLLTLCGRAMRFLGCPVRRPSAQCAGLFCFPFFFHSLTPLLSHVPPPARFFATRRLCRVPPLHGSVMRRPLTTRLSRAATLPRAAPRHVSPIVLPRRHGTWFGPAVNGGDCVVGGRAGWSASASASASAGASAGSSILSL